MGKKIGKQSVLLENLPSIQGYYSIVGKMEGEGNFKKYFHKILDDDKLGEKTFERAERKIIKSTIESCIKQSKLKESDIDLILGGDLLNQIISTTFAVRDFNIPYLGVYGACSTMGEAIAVGSCLVEGNLINNCIAVTGTHFSTAERQYRFPLELGNQRPPTSQWTVTGSGGCVIGKNKSKIKIHSVTFGKVIDYDVKDVNNMGAAMAPAAMDSLIAHFEDTNTNPEDYDLIVTGDLGKMGSEILMDLMEHQDFKLGKNYNDCGQMMFTCSQRTFQGASGAGCSASILCSYIFKKMERGEFKNVLFAPTGALLSTTSSQQGESIPSICNVVHFVSD